MTSYVALHRRVVKLRSKAAQHECARCAEDGAGRKARDWATIHGADGSDLWADYVPLCRSCHKKYDYVDDIGMKISRANTGRPKSASEMAAITAAAARRRGYRHTPEAIEKTRQVALGKEASPETRAKQRTAHLGQRHTPESLEKIRQAKRDYWAQLSPAERSQRNKRGR